MLFSIILSIICTTIASPIYVAETIATSSSSLTNRSVSEADIVNFSFYAEHASAAYCNAGAAIRSKLSCGGNCPTIERNGAAILKSSRGSKSGISCYISIDRVRKEIVLAVRGSANVQNWITNVDFNFEDSPVVGGGKAHDGFNRAWEEIRFDVTTSIRSAIYDNPGYRVIATGHSLGGAVATLATAQLRNDGIEIDLYTYGAPRCGNDKLVDYITDQIGREFRITHRDDPVPRLPPIVFGYRHTSPEYWLFKEDSKGEGYPVKSIRVCEGNANIMCNGGTLGINGAAHNMYFGPVSSCGPPITDLNKAVKNATELELRLNGWSKEDSDYVLAEY